MAEYNSIFERFSKFIKGLDVFNAVSNGTIGSTQLSGIGQRVIDKSLANELYGNPDQFLGRLKDFEETYYQKLSDPANIRRSRVNSIDAGVMRQTGDIDLSVFNVNTRRELENILHGDIVKTPDLFANAGFPSLRFPSASPYRMPFKFEVDQGLEHPAQVLLNRMIFNIDPQSSSIADVRFGTTNFMSAADIERNMYQIDSMRKGNLLQFGTKNDGTMRKVITFDVETTGLGSSSQVRSVALAERTSLDALPTTSLKFGYDSPQLGGFLAGPKSSETLSDFISKGENLGNLAKTEEEFLSNMKRAMKALNEADQVTGHNVGFDINQMIRTMSGMSGYHQDDELKGLVETFLARKNTDKNFVVDTLEIGRAYITEKAQSMIDAKGTPLVRGEEYIKKFFSAESLADVTMGGKATYVGVENFAMNTNLLDLMAEEKYAPEIFRKIFQGSHIAETDTLLQDHILKYMHTGKLGFRDGVINKDTAELVNVARKTIFKSAATTPVTNIADPRLLTETALGYVKGEGLTGVRATISMQEAKEMGATSQSAGEGFIKYEKGSYRLFTGLEDEGQILNQQKAQSYLRGIIDKAMEGDNASISALGGKFSYNAAEKQIMSLGVTYGQNSAIGVMERTLGITAGEINPERYVENIGNLFRNFADEPTRMQFRNIRRGAQTVAGAHEANFNFSVGLRSGKQSATDVMGKFVAHAEASLGSGNKFGFLGIRESAFSTMFSSATSGLATDLYTKATLGDMEETAAKVVRDRLSFAASSDIADITSQIGVGNLVKQSDFYLAGGDGPAKKMLVSYEYFKNLEIQNGIRMSDKIAANEVGISLSVATRGGLGDEYDIINAVWKSGRDESGLTSEKLAQQMYDDFIKAEDGKGILKDASAELQEQVQMFRQAYSGQSEPAVVQSIKESIDERGIGIASFGTKETQDQVVNIIESANRMGVDLANDQTSYMMRLLGETENLIQTSHAYDRTVIEAGGDAARQAMKRATESSINDANKLGTALLENDSLRRRALGNLRAGRGQTGISRGIDLYHAYKGPVGIAALGLTALAAGYYIGKRKKENNLYNETLEQQPTESFRQNDARNNYTSSVTSFSSSRRDPLVTAGVMGELDSRKIGHTQMGNNKYNHLYGR